MSLSDQRADTCTGQPVSIGNFSAPDSFGAYTQAGQNGGFEIENTTFVGHKAALVCCTWAGVGRNAWHTTFRKVKFVGNKHRANPIDPELPVWSGLHKVIWRDEDGSLSGTGKADGAGTGKLVG